MYPNDDEERDHLARTLATRLQVTEKALQAILLLWIKSSPEPEESYTRLEAICKEPGQHAPEFDTFMDDLLAGVLSQIYVQDT